MLTQSAILAQILFNGIASGALYALIAIGFSLVYLVHRFFYLAFAGVILASALTFVLAHNSLQLSFFTSAIVALSIALICSAINEALLHAPSRKWFSSDDALSPFIVSSVALLIYQNAFLLLFGPGSYLISLPIKTFTVGEVTVSIYQLGQIALLLPVVIATAIIWNATTLGIKLRAMRDSLLLSQTCGLNVNYLFMITTLAAGLLGGIAAITLTLNQDIRYSLGAVVILKAITATILGGDRGPVGVAFGGIFIGVFEALATWIFPTGLSDALIGLFLVVILVVAPRGLLSISIRAQ